MSTLQFLTDPAAFLDAAGDYLALEPVLSTVVSTVAERMAEKAAAGQPPRSEDWWVVVRDSSGAVVGAGMRTAQFGDRPPFLLPMPEAAARDLARALHERGELLTAVNGALPATRLCADEQARLSGGSVRVAQHTRLFELGELSEPAPVPGSLRRATDDDVDLALDWFGAFMADADAQAGREPGTSAHETPDRPDMLARIAAGRVWFWIDEHGERVHMTGSNPPSFGVARIGPVYTPPGRRGHGYASAAVAQVSRDIVAAGARACLFTDQANPTSNRIYQALGYRPVADMANLLIERPTP